MLEGVLVGVFALLCSTPPSVFILLAGPLYFLKFYVSLSRRPFELARPAQHDR